MKNSKYGFIYADFKPIEIDKLFEILQTDDLHRIDRELDHLNSLRNSKASLSDGNVLVNNKGIRKYLHRIDLEIEKAYDEYSILRIRYLMDIL